jgi:hypothetical protein
MSLPYKDINLAAAPDELISRMELEDLSGKGFWYL